MKRKGIIGLLLIGTMLITPTTAAFAEENNETLVYGSGDYTRINPAMDEHGEINIMIFNGLTAHDGDNQVVPGLAKSWDYDEETCTYTFLLEEGVTWHDGEPFGAEDAKFTIEAIHGPGERFVKMRPTSRMWKRLRWWTIIQFPSGWRRRMWLFWTT